MAGEILPLLENISRHVPLTARIRSVYSLPRERGRQVPRCRRPILPSAFLPAPFCQTVAEFSSYIHCRPPPQFFVFAARLPYALYMWTHAESGAGWYSIKTGRCPSQNRPYTLPCGQPRLRSRPDIGEDKREGLQCPIPPLRGPPAGASAFNLVPVPFQRSALFKIDLCLVLLQSRCY